MQQTNMLAKQWDKLSPGQKEEYLLQITDDMDLVDKYSNFMWNELPDEVTNNIVANSSLKENQNIKRTMNKESLKALIKECYKEVLAENEDLPMDTGKNINMGMGSTEIGLDINKAKQGKISKLQMAIDELSKKIKYNLDLYKAGKMSVQDYKSAIGDSPAKLKSLAAALEAELTKAAKI
jgi:hypothetical protein